MAVVMGKMLFRLVALGVILGLAVARSPESPHAGMGAGKPYHNEWVVKLERSMSPDVYGL